MRLLSLETDVLKSERGQLPNNDSLSVAPTGLYALGTVVDVKGETRDLAEFSGNVTIVVNVASYCGFTETNYKGLQALYDKYKDQGFVVLAFPCNQFGKQEPNPNKVIETFAHEHYNITFPLFAKIDVNGPQTHKIFAFLKANLPHGEEDGVFNPQFVLQWNFQKFLVNRNGYPVELFTQDFDQEKIEAKLFMLLKKELPTT